MLKEPNTYLMSCIDMMYLGCLGYIILGLERFCLVGLISGKKSGDLPANLNRGLMSAGSSLGFVLVASKKSDQNVQHSE